MLALTAAAVGTLATLSQVSAIAAPFRRSVDTTYPYKGPTIPIADPVDQTINGNGKGYIRLWEPPAVEPELGSLPTNNINVISLSYVPEGMNVHFQTPHGIGQDPFVLWGTDPTNLNNTATGWTSTYDRQPPCSLVHVTQCSQYYHNVALTNLAPATKYYYQIPGGNGTKASELQEFTTARVAGDETPFDVIVVHDMGYTNAQGTQRQMLNHIADLGTTMVLHGGDISYADDLFFGLAACAPHNASLPLNSTAQPVCYNGSASTLPGGVDEVTYYIPVPQGIPPSQGSPRGGDMSTMYESNWDLWQQWMTPIAKSVPYMVAPGNHEASCAGGDNSAKNEVSAVLEDNLPPGSSAPVSNVTYWSCPPSQRNFTAYRHRFTMPGNDTLEGSGNMWYSFTYGLAHFIVFSGETDYPTSPEVDFAYRLKGNETVPRENATKPRDSGPFGQVTGNITMNESYEQWNWMKHELASVDRSVTPWLFVMNHRGMYSSYMESYMPPMRKAWEDLFLNAGVDVMVAGHIHSYERLFPLGRNFTIDHDSVINNNTYYTNPGKSITYILNGQGGNVQSHSILAGNALPFSAAFDESHYGFGKFGVVNRTHATWQFVKGNDGSIGDYLTLIKKDA